MLELTLAGGSRFENLTVFPIIASAPLELPYNLLTEALERGTLRITEVGSGTVPELLATNQGEADVLVLDGEQLIGARQNRMTNRSILLPGHSTTRIPVSCMEQGRWHFASADMAPAKQHSPSKVRRHARREEAKYAAVGETPSMSALAEAQSSVWSEIRESVDDLGAHSPTLAMNDVYGARERDLDEWARRFPRSERQVGLLAFVDGEPLGLDVIGGQELYARLHHRLLCGYAMDAMTSRPRSTRDTATPAEPGVTTAALAGIETDAVNAAAFLDAVRAAGRVDAPTVGRGRYNVLSGGVVGGELADGDGLPHLSAFPAEPRASATSPLRSGPRITPPSRRRRTF